MLTAAQLALFTVVAMPGWSQVQNGANAFILSRPAARQHQHRDNRAAIGFQQPGLCRNVPDTGYEWNIHRQAVHFLAEQRGASTQFHEHGNLHVLSLSASSGGSSSIWYPPRGNAKEIDVRPVSSHVSGWRSFASSWVNFCKQVLSTIATLLVAACIVACKPQVSLSARFFIYLIYAPWRRNS